MAMAKSKSRRKRIDQSTNDAPTPKYEMHPEIVQTICYLLQSYLPLSAGMGHLPASTYDDLLELHEKDQWMPQEEADLDCICQALELEESRREMIETLREVGTALHDTVETYSSHIPDLYGSNRIDRNCIQFNTNLSAIHNSNDKLQINLPYEKLENALRVMSDCLQTHETQLASFRSNVYSWAHSLFQAFARAGETTQFRTQTHNAMGKYYQHFCSVQQDVLQHLNWEQNLLLKLQAMMENATFYSPFDDALGLDDTDSEESKRVAQVLEYTLQQWREGLSFGTKKGGRGVLWKQTIEEWIHAMVEDLSVNHKEYEIKEIQISQEQERLSSAIEPSYGGEHMVDADPKDNMNQSDCNKTTGSTSHKKNRLHPKCKAMQICQPLQSFLDSFCRRSNVDSLNHNGDNPIAFALLVGSPSSGKTHLCQSLALHLQQSNPTILVLKPRLASTLNGQTVGSAEDSIISLLEYALKGSFREKRIITSRSGERQKCVLILDDIVEHMLGASISKGFPSSRDSVETKPNHMSIRKRAIWLSLMDHVRAMNSKCTQESSRQVLILCTTAPRQSFNGSLTIEDDALNRFDKVFFLKPPTAEERRYMIQSLLGISFFESVNQTLISDGDKTIIEHDKDSIAEGNYDDRDFAVVERLLASIVESTIGKTRGEIALYCRDAYRECSTSSNNPPKQLPAQELQTLSSQNIQKRLRCLKTSLQERVPESVSTSTIKGDANLTVVSARELRAGLQLDDEGNEKLPLIGNHAEMVFKKLEDLVITPLCRWKALDELLYGEIPAFSQRGVSRSGGICAGYGL